MEFENLLVERRDDVLVVTLNRPQKLNALSLGLLVDLKSCGEYIERERERGAVVVHRRVECGALTRAAARGRGRPPGCGCARPACRGCG